MTMKRKSWQDYQKEIADDHYYYARSCIRQNFFPGSEKLFIDMLRNDLGKDLSDDPKHSSCTGIGYHSDIVPLETIMTVVARQFALMGEAGYENLVTSCITSFGVYTEILATWHEFPETEEKTRENLWKATRREFKKPASLAHTSDVVFHFREEIAARAKKRLVNAATGEPLKVVEHIGCHYAKIFPKSGIGGSEFPYVLAGMVESWGGECVDYPERRHCCGFGFRNYLVQANRGYSIANSHKKLESMAPYKPDFIVANCPGCAMFLVAVCDRRDGGYDLRRERSRHSGADLRGDGRAGAGLRPLGAGHADAPGRRGTPAGQDGRRVRSRGQVSGPQREIYRKTRVGGGQLLPDGYDLRHQRIMKKRVIIIGGGVAGMQTALRLAEQGVSPVIIEKEAELGGKLRGWHVLFPSFTPAQEVLTELRRRVNESGIEVMTSTEVAGFTKESVTLADGRTLPCDSVVVASGFTLFNASIKEEYGYGIYDNVFTTADIERMLNEGRVAKADGSRPRRIAFLHCVGSRDEKVCQQHCSKVCCITGVKQAMEMKQLFPEADVFNFYMDIRMFGPGYEEMYREAQQRYNIHFLRGRISEASPTIDGRVQIKAEDTLTGRPLRMSVDMLVLIVGMRANDDNEAFAAGAGLNRAPSGFLAPRDMFLGNVKSNVDGIFYAGTITAPKNIGESLNEGIAAADAAAKYVEA